MKILYKLKDYILKYPVLFWVVVLTYIVSVIILILNKREVDTYSFIFSYIIVGIGLATYYKFYASIDQRKLTKDWLKLYTSTKKLRKKILHQILFLSGWGVTFGCLAFLTFLLKFHWLFSFFLFILQFVTSIIIMILYISSKKITNIVGKIKSGAILGVAYILLDFISKNFGRSFVTDIISVSPEQVPTITQGLYWFCFILFASAFLQLIAIFWLDLAKNKKLLKKISFITYFLVFISAFLPCQLINFNAIVIIDVVISKTYDADTVLYFKCDNKIIKNVPNDTARYLKVDEQEFRAFYFEKGKSNIQMTTYLCNGSDYSEIDIHK